METPPSTDRTIAETNLLFISIRDAFFFILFFILVVQSSGIFFV